jgi:hypothetical protein
MPPRSPRLMVVLALTALVGCAKMFGSDKPAGGGNGGGNPGGGNPGGGSGNGGSAGGNGPGPDGGTLPPPDAQGPATPAKSCGELPQLQNLRAIVRADNVSVSFDPVGGAKDYRIYPVGPDGKRPTRDAIYRCAGSRGAPSIPLDLPMWDNNMGAMEAFVAHDVEGYKRSQAEATLGHVWVTPGDGRLPVYSLGDPAPNADNACYAARWDEGRVKKYVASEAERNTLLSNGWRDFGIVFYVPSPGTAGTVPVQTAIMTGNPAAAFYFNSDAEKAARGNLNPTAAFQVLAAAGDGTQPLMRVYYKNGCGMSHDELVAGQGRFENATRQGQRPLNILQWSGLTGPTTIAIEALDNGCPWQGHLSPQSKPAFTSMEKISHQAFLSLDQIKAADPMGEVFVNGQTDGAPRPNPIACSQIQVMPGPAETGLDFHDDFTTDPGPFTDMMSPGFKWKHFTSPKYDMGFASVDDPAYAYGVMFGEFWITYGDWAADTNGKFRLSPNQKGTLAAGNFLYVTMEVDMVTSGRRYPQIMISDRPAPLQDGTADNLSKGTTIVVETINPWPGRVDIQLCDHRNWDVNNQCPHFVTDWATDLSTLSPPKPQPPTPIVGELSGVDRRVRWEVWASTDRVYVSMDGQRMACAVLPGGKMPAGPVTVAYGDVLYHSGVDVPDPPYVFHAKHMKTETRRHFDELGFKNGVGAPPWDEKNIPCGVATKQ